MNGLKIQWTTIDGNGSTKEWSFPVAFSSGYTFIANPWANSTSQASLQYYGYQKSLTSIKYMSLSGGKTELIAIGY